MRVKLKRVYDAPEASDGLRVLVDGIWPRGLSREAARIHTWARELAPSTELRRWFGHDPARWGEFKRRYFLELDGRTQALGRLRELGRGATLTLVYAAKDTEHNNARALKEYLERR